MTKFQAQPSYRSICISCIDSLSTVLNKKRREAIVSILCLFLSIPKVNFLQLARYSKSCEQYFRIHFSKSFDWLSFNIDMVKKHTDQYRVIAFDPSYIPKSGKKTEGVDKFWSGCASKVKRGLEICGIAALDMNNNTAMHLKAVQTILNENENLLQFYARILAERATELKEISNILVADAYFSKAPFVNAMNECGFTVVSRLRDDASLFHKLETKLESKKRGRPKTKGEKVDFKDLSLFQLINQDNDQIIYSAIVYSKALKKDIRITYVQYLKMKTNKIYFSTDTEMDPLEILKIYRTRFQIEFLYRDAKQHTSLTKCEARSKEKLDFHFNASLTAINLAKVKHWYSCPVEKRTAFSMENIKIMNHNKLIIDRIMSKFGIDPNIHKNKQYVKDLISYGTSTTNVA